MDTTKSAPTVVFQALPVLSPAVDDAHARKQYAEQLFCCWQLASWSWYHLLQAATTAGLEKSAVEAGFVVPIIFYFLSISSTQATLLSICRAPWRVLLLACASAYYIKIHVRVQGQAETTVLGVLYAVNKTQAWAPQTSGASRTGGVGFSASDEKLFADMGEFAALK